MYRFFKESCFISIDYKEMNNYFKNKIWFWNVPGHMCFDGYKLLAEKVFKVIKKAVLKNVKSCNFYIEGDSKFTVKNYLSLIKDKLKIDKTYQYIYKDINLKKTFTSPKIGAIVMNCNPFTYGHQYLIATASKLTDLLYIFVVEENKSIFSFKNRFSMVKEGTLQYKNVIVLPSGEFMISSTTFPGYFFKEVPTKECYDDFLDLKIFAHYIAPGLGINMRFVGEEPLDKVTAQYNYDMKEILKNVGVDVIEIPRKKIDNEVISATKVRKLLNNREYILLRKYIPETTMKYL